MAAVAVVAAPAAGPAAAEPAAPEAARRPARRYRSRVKIADRARLAARAYNRAVARGSIRPGMDTARALHISRHTAANYITHARQLGLIPPAGPRRPVPHPTERDAELARLYNEAVAARCEDPEQVAALAAGIKRKSAGRHLARARQHGLLDQPAPADPGPVAGRYLAWMRHRGFSEETITGRRQFLRRLAADLPVPLAEATAADLAAWRAGLTVTRGSVARYVSHARAFYRWAAAEGIRADNPAARIPAPRTGRRLPRPVAEPDLQDALDGAPPRIRTWLVLAAWSGLRACEIAYLRRENVLEHATPPVLVIAADATKGTTERIVPLSTFALAELVPHLPGSGYVFRRADGQPGPNKPSRISQLCCDYLRAAGIPATLHQFRHRFGTQAYRIRHDLRAVQELMGHHNPATTAGYVLYAAQQTAADVEAIPAPRRPGLTRAAS